MVMYTGATNAGTQVNSLQDFEPSWGSKMHASVRESWLESYGPVAVDYINSNLIEYDGTKLTGAAVAAKLKESGLKAKLDLTDGRYTPEQLDVIINRQTELAAVRDVRDRTPWDLGSPIRGAAMFGAGIVDPVNLATAFVPWTKLLPAAAGLRAAASAGAGIGERTLARAVIGGADAGISTAAIELPYSIARNDIGDDYGALDSVANIAFGTAFGAGIHTGGGAAGDLIRYLRTGRASTAPAVPVSADGSPVIEGGEADAAAIREQLVTPVEIPPIQRGAADAAAMGENRAVLREDGTISATESQAAVDSFVAAQPEADRINLVDETGALTPEGQRRMTAAAVARNYGDTPAMNRLANSLETGDRAVTVALIRSLPVVDNARFDMPIENLQALDIVDDITTAADTRSQMIADGQNVLEYLESPESLDSTAISPEQLTIMDYIERNQGSPKRIGDMIEDYYNRVSDADAPVTKAAALADAIRTAESQPTPAVETVNSVSPETREAAVRASVAQMLDGREVDVEAIVNMDESIGTSSVEDMTAAADRSFRPENKSSSDIEASEMFQEMNDTAPHGYETMEDAQSALDESTQLLDYLIAAGDDAYKYSRGAELPEGAEIPDAVPELDAAIRRSFGDATDSMVESGQITIVNTPEDIPGGLHPGDVKAATAPDGRVYVVASNVSEAEARGIVLHEVGVHVGMENMVGPAVFGDILNQIDDAILRGESWATSARNSVPADTPAGLVREEQLAYLVQNAPEQPLVKRIIGAIRAWAYRTFNAARTRMMLTEADYQAMAVSALREQGRARRMGELSPAFSRDAAQTDTKQFRDWFGDSKVVDGTGAPMVLYHGTGAMVDDNFAFNPSKIGSTGAAEGYGFYLTTDRDTAEGYRSSAGGSLVQSYVSMKKPMPVGQAGFSRPNLEKIINKMIDAEIAQGDTGDYRDTFISNYVDTYSASRKNAVREVADIISGSNESAIDQIAELGNSSGDKVATHNSVRDITGFDGILSDGYGGRGEAGGNIYVAWFPEQIKSTDNTGSFDPSDARIRYSRGPVQDPSTIKNELQPYQDAIDRAKQYSTVLRAAADKLGNDAQATAAMRAAMPDISPAEINDLLAQLRQRVKGLSGMARTARNSLLAADVANGLQSDAMKAADELSNNLAMAAVIEKRNAQLNIAARVRIASAMTQYKDSGLDFEGFMAELVGTERRMEGGRLSIDAEQKNFRGQLVGGFIADLDKAGQTDTFTSGKFDREIYQATWDLSIPGRDMSAYSPEVRAVAEILQKYNTAARNLQNRFGAWIGELPGYVTAQSHDMLKIRHAGVEDFKKTILPLLDMERTRGENPGDVDAFLNGLYDSLASGVHLKSLADPAEALAFRGQGAALARKVSQDRVIHFKDGAAAFEYNKKFGGGTLAEAVVHGLEKSARTAGLLKKGGTNPRANYERAFDEYAQRLIGEDPKRRAKFQQKRKTMSNVMDVLDGTINIPGSAQAAQVFGWIRALQSMAKLGGMLISSITDLGSYGAELRFAQGKNLASGTLEGAAAVIRGRSSGEKKAILNSLGVFHESIIGQTLNRFDNPDLRAGVMSKMMQQFFKLTGQNRWTESLRDSYVLSHSNYLASNTGTAFEKLPNGLGDMLSLYNIDAAKWEALRNGPTQLADGRNYLTPESVATIPRAALENYITGIGRTVSDTSVQNLRDDLASSLRAMAIDRATHAVVEPNARARAFMTQGQQPGTVTGEILRLVGQFKSFPVAMTQMILGREIYGRGYNTLGDYVKNGRGDMLGMVTLMATYTALGYAAMSIKDLLKGKNPRPMDDPRTWLAAFIQGGGAGIYGDFLFGKFDRMGGTVTSTLAGPTFGNLDAAFDIWSRIRSGDDAAAAGFRFAMNNTPFINLFYTRTAMDYLFLYQIQEAMNPGFLRRMERRTEREAGQTYYLPPSQAVR